MILLFFLQYLINMQLPLSKMYIIVWEERKEARQTLPLVNSKNAVITSYIHFQMKLTLEFTSHLKAIEKEHMCTIMCVFSRMYTTLVYWQFQPITLPDHLTELHSHDQSVGKDNTRAGPCQNLPACSLRLGCHPSLDAVQIPLSAIFFLKGE